MAYLDDLLGRGEQVLHVGRQHLFLLISRIIAELLVIAVLVAAGVFSYNAFDGPSPIFQNMTGGTLIMIVCLTGIIIVLISGLIDYLRWSIEQYIITDRRVIQIRGVLNKVVIDSSLGKINDIELRQSLMGRVFDFGTVSILTASDEAVNVMEQIAAPLEFKRALLEAKNRYEHGYGYLPAYPSAKSAHSYADIQRTLEELAALRDRGILSVDEFEAKKRELLSRI